jgi:hypothetical protein
MEMSYEHMVRFINDFGYAVDDMSSSSPSTEDQE